MLSCARAARWPPDGRPAHTLAIDVSTSHILNDAVTTADCKQCALRARTVHARPTHSPHNYAILHRTAVTPHAARHRLDADTIALAGDAPCTRYEHTHTLITHMRRPWRDVTATHTQPHKTQIVHCFGCGPARTRRILISIYWCDLSHQTRRRSRGRSERVMWMSAIQPREPQCKNERAHSVRTLKSMMKTYSLHDE